MRNILLYKTTKITLSRPKTAPWWLILTAIISFNGCQQLPKQTPASIDNKTRQARQQQLEQLQHWQAKGKFVFISPKKKQSLSLNWMQDSTRADIRLNSFLGLSVLKMVTDQQAATLQADGKTFSSSNPQQLLQRTTGITLPVSDLPQWMKGATALDKPEHLLVWDEYNRLKQVRLVDASFQPWQIDYLSYATIEQTPQQSYQLPRKLRLTGGDIKITITINDWILNRD